MLRGSLCTTLRFLGCFILGGLSLSLQIFVHPPYAGSLRTLVGIIYRFDGLDARNIYSIARRRVGNDVSRTEAEASIGVGRLLWETEHSSCSSG